VQDKVAVTSAWNADIRYEFLVTLGNETEHTET
jgi:hypothetical protein